MDIASISSREHLIRIVPGGRCELLVKVIANSKDEAIAIALREASFIGWPNAKLVRARTNLIENSYGVTVVR